MADQNRKPQSNKQNRQQQSSQGSQGGPGRDNTSDTQHTEGARRNPSESMRDDDNEGMNERSRSNREPSSVAHDRGIDSSRRSFSQDRESDELGSELERETGLYDSDEEEEGDNIDRPGRSNR